MRSYSFQATKFKLHRNINDSSGQVVDGLTVLRNPRGVRNKGLITQNTLNRRAFAQFSRYRVQTSQERQRFLGTGREGVDDSTVPPEGSEMKG